MTTPTMTDDIGPRIAAVEADIRNVKTLLERMHAEQQESRREQQAENRAMRAEILEARREQQAENRAMNARIDQLNDRIDRLGARIERVFWAVISVGLIIGAGIVGAMLTMLFRLT